MKIRILFFSIGALVILAWGCKTVPTQVAPHIEGCLLTVTALGNHLVSGMDWTNAQTGHGGVGGQSMQITDFDSPGAVVNVYADPSIACATNEPTIAVVTWKCKTNNAVSQFWTLPSACNGFRRTVTGTCSNCIFQVSQAVGFDCYIYNPGPPKKL